MSEDRVVIYIDGQNLRFKLQDIGLQEKDVNWGKLFSSLVPASHVLIRAYWYQAARIAPWEWKSHLAKYTPQGMTPAQFERAATDYYRNECERLEKIHQIVYERIERTYDSVEFRYSGVLKVEPTRVTVDSSGQTQIGTRVGEKGVDVALAVDLVRHAEHYDTAILITGDFDLVPAIQAVKDRLRRVIVVSVMKGTPPHHQGHARRLTSLCDQQIEIFESDLKDKNKFGV
ncbi:MAG: NYN domain-containing protein [Deltaproteobacteria bacterium]|nr:NYN domain-containing protein [Deltaproteobacteria bacterium]